MSFDDGARPRIARLSEFLPGQSSVKNRFVFLFRLPRRKIRGVPPLNSPFHHGRTERALFRTRHIIPRPAPLVKSRNTKYWIFSALLPIRPQNIVSFTFLFLSDKSHLTAAESDLFPAISAGAGNFPRRFAAYDALFLLRL